MPSANAHLAGPEERELDALIDALRAAEYGIPIVPLPPQVVDQFLSEAAAFRRTVAFAALKLIAHFARDRSAEVRARAISALEPFLDAYEREVEDELLRRVDDPSPDVRLQVVRVVGALLARSKQAAEVRRRFREHSRDARRAIRLAAEWCRRADEADLDDAP